MDVTIAVATYGDDEWKTLAARRAIPSAQKEATVAYAHGETLADARNRALELVETEWVIHLDADDELERGYVHALANHATADVRVPAVSYIKGGRPRAPFVQRVAGHRHRCGPECLEQGNWIIVGAAVRADMVRAVGGWREWPVYEDWDLWVRCWQAGATFEPCSRAIYKAHFRIDSRNRGPKREVKEACHAAIAEANGLPLPVPE